MGTAGGSSSTRLLWHDSFVSGLTQDIHLAEGIRSSDAAHPARSITALSGTQGTHQESQENRLYQPTAPPRSCAPSEMQIRFASARVPGVICRDKNMLAGGLRVLSSVLLRVIKQGLDAGCLACSRSSPKASGSWDFHPL